MAKNELKKFREVWVDGKMMASFKGESIPSDIRRLVTGHFKGIEIKVFWIDEEGVKITTERKADGESDSK